MLVTPVAGKSSAVSPTWHTPWFRHWFSNNGCIKHAFKCIRTRLVLIRRKKEAMIRFFKKDVADLLSNGLDTHAFGRMDGLVIEMNHAYCYDMIEQYCNYIGNELNRLQKQRDCPQETREAVSTLIFAAARFPDLPELCDLRNIFTERYGNFLEPFVSLQFVRKLDSELFTKEEKFQIMQSVAEEFSLSFDTKALENKLCAAVNIKDDLLEKDSLEQIDLVMPLSNKQEEEEGALCETKSEAVPVGHKQNLEAQLKPLGVQDIGQSNDNIRRQHSDKSDDKEHLKKSVSHFDIRKENTQKEVQKASKKGVRPCLNELMEAVELDINGLPKQELGSRKLETECNKTVASIAKQKEAKKEHGVEKENVKGLGSDPNVRHANAGFKALGLQNQGYNSVSPSRVKTNKKFPPYAKPNGDLSQKVQDGQGAPGRTANMRPPRIKPKFIMQAVNNDPGKRVNYSKHNISKQTYHLADKDVLRPVSVRRKKPPAPHHDYDEAPNNEYVTRRTPSSRKQKGATDGNDQTSSGIDDDAGGNGRNVQRTPISQPSHSNRRSGPSYNDDYDGIMPRHQTGEDHETAIASGDLLPRVAEGHHQRLKSRNTNVHNGDVDYEDRMMDKLLMHFSRKGLEMGETRTGKEINTTADHDHKAQASQCEEKSPMQPPVRAISLPPRSVSQEEDAKVPGRSTSLHQDCPRSVRVLVHPKMPDFDELTARVNALRNAS